MRHTFYTWGQKWDGYIDIDGKVVPYELVESFDTGSVDLTGDRGVLIGQVHMHVWLGKDYDIPEDLRMLLWPSELGGI